MGFQWQPPQSIINAAGTLAQRPAANSVASGYQYLVTDLNGGTLYRSDGTTWAQVAPPVQIPLSSINPNVWPAVNLRGTLAARPAAAAGNAGFTYYATDNGGGTLYRSTGTAWEQVASSVSASGVADGSITNAKLAADAVQSVNIADGTIVNADISAAAAIAYSKLALGGSIVNADVATGAAIAYSKLALGSSIVNADIAAAAAIAYSKLALGGSIVNADIAPAAAIAYSKLALGNSIVAGDLTSGAVTNSKLAANAAFLTGLLAAMPVANTVKAGTLYFATDNAGGTVYVSDGATATAAPAGWTQVASSVSAAGVADGSIGGAKLASDVLGWTTVAQAIGHFGGNTAAASWALCGGGGVVDYSTAALGIAQIPIYAADYAVVGKTTKLRLLFITGMNANAPNADIACALKPITASAGSTSALTLTLGTAVATATVTAPAANTRTKAVSSTISLPTDGVYALAPNPSATTHGASVVQMACFVQIAHV